MTALALATLLALGDSYTIGESVAPAERFPAQLAAKIHAANPQIIAKTGWTTDELDKAISAFVKKEYSLALGERTAEEIKMKMGSALPLMEELNAEIRGRDLVTGLPKTILVSTEEIREAIAEPVTDDIGHEYRHIAPAPAHFLAA